MMTVATDPTETRSIASKPVRYQVARAVIAGALGAAGVVTLSAAGLALFFGLTAPTNPASVSSQPAHQPDIEADAPALQSGNLVTLPQTEREAKPVVAEQTSERVAPVQEIAATPEALPMLPQEMAARLVSSGANLLSTTPFGPLPVAAVPAEVVQTRDTPAEPVEPETVATRTVVTKPRAAVTKKEVANPVSKRVSAAASTKKAASIAPVHSSAMTQPRGAGMIRARSVAKTLAASSHEPQRHKVPAKPTVARAAVAVAEATAPKAQAAQAPTEAEQPESTEVFGLKVPSLAPAGRKIQESVEALGKAIKSLPDRF
jgi:hypothetical protein